jgi:Tol biopolymer transport system component
VFADFVDGSWDLFMAAPDGSGVRRLTDDRAEDLSPDWSPDGRQIVHTRCESGADSCDLFVIGADGSNPTPLTDTPWISETRPRWSPDGTRILFEAVEDGAVIVGVMDLDSGPVTMLTDDSSASGGADWSPDGTLIVYHHSPWTAGGTGAGELWVMNADGTDQHAITHAPQVVSKEGEGWPVDHEPKWSQDGTLIAFTRGLDVYVVAPDGSGLTNLTPGGVDLSDRVVAWSPDGRILFASDRGSGDRRYRLYTMNPDGSDVRPFLDRTVATCCPEADWSGAATYPNTTEPEPTSQPTPTETSSPGVGEDIGLGFPVCNVSSIEADFARTGVAARAFVATRIGDLGECPQPDEAFNVVALDANDDGVAETSYGPIECAFECRTFSAPDLDGDGTAELLVVQSGGSVLALVLYDVMFRDGAPVVEPVTFAPPGDPAGGFEPGELARFLLGGDEFFVYTLRCGDLAMRDGPGFVVTAAESLPHDSPEAQWHAHRTLFALVDGSLQVRDVSDFTEPAGFDPPSFQSEETLCGSNLGP